MPLTYPKRDIPVDYAGTNNLETEYLIDRLQNVNQVGEGTNIPPPQLGEFRVPFVTRVQAVNVTQSFPGTQLTLTWLEPEGYTNVNMYRIYAQSVYANNQQPIYIASSAHSPCTFTLPGTIAGTAVVFVQTVLNNGLANPVLRCPTTTVTTQDTVLTAGAIAAGSITTDKLNIVDILVTGLTLTNNSPTAGKVAWSACTVYYQGVAYSVASGSTTNATDKFISWTIGNGTFTSGSYTPSKTIFLIATNTSGVGDTAWNKVALSHVQEDQLATSLLKGMALQPPAITTSATPLLTYPSTSSTTTLLNVGAGALLTFRIDVVTPFTLHNYGINDQMTASLRITIDGSTAQTFAIMSAHNAYAARDLDFDLRVFELVDSGLLSTAGNYFIASLQLPAAASILVELVYTSSTVTALNPNQSFDGSLKLSCGYALKTSA